MELIVIALLAIFIAILLGVIAGIIIWYGKYIPASRQRRKQKDMFITSEYLRFSNRSGLKPQ